MKKSMKLIIQPKTCRTQPGWRLLRGVLTRSQQRESYLVKKCRTNTCKFLGQGSFFLFPSSFSEWLNIVYMLNAF